MSAPEPVLVVEDDRDLREVLLEQLRESGFEAVGAESVDCAMGFLRTGTFRVVLSDVRMPGRDGFQLLREVRECGDGARVILMAAFGDAAAAERARRAGAFDLLSKPFRPGALAEAIHRALHESGLP
jgi:DNA-binding NtrC family response regulator